MKKTYFESDAFGGSRVILRMAENTIEDTDAALRVLIRAEDRCREHMADEAFLCEIKDGIFLLRRAKNHLINAIDVIEAGNRGGGFGWNTYWLYKFLVKYLHIIIYDYRYSESKDSGELLRRNLTKTFEMFTPPDSGNITVSEWVSELINYLDTTELNVSRSADLTFRN